MAVTKTFKFVDGSVKTLTRTVGSFRKALVAEQKLEKERQKFNDLLEEDIEFDGVALLDTEIKLLELRIDYLAELFETPVDNFEEFDPKAISDLYNDVYLWESTREDTLSESDEASKILESMTQSNK